MTPERASVRFQRRVILSPVPCFRAMGEVLLCMGPWGQIQTSQSLLPVHRPSPGPGPDPPQPALCCTMRPRDKAGVAGGPGRHEKQPVRERVPGNHVGAASPCAVTALLQKGVHGVRSVAPENSAASRISFCQRDFVDKILSTGSHGVSELFLAVLLTATCLG